MNEKGEYLFIQLNLQKINKILIHVKNAKIIVFINYYNCC